MDITSDIILERLRLNNLSKWRIAIQHKYTTQAYEHSFKTKRAANIAYKKIKSACANYNDFKINDRSDFVEIVTDSGVMIINIKDIATIILMEPMEISP